MWNTLVIIQPDLFIGVWSSVPLGFGGCMLFGILSSQVSLEASLDGQYDNGKSIEFQIDYFQYLLKETNVRREQKGDIELETTIVNPVNPSNQNTVDNTVLCFFLKKLLHFTESCQNAYTQPAVEIKVFVFE